MNNRPRVPRPVAVGTAAALMAGLAVAVTTAATTAGPPRGAAAPPPDVLHATATSAITPTAAAPHVPELSWANCDDGFQCATVQVPLDYQHPHGATVGLSVIELPAAGDARPAGTLFINTGGPAAQVAGFADGGAADLPAPLRRFNIVTFDERGLGQSDPVQCFPNADAESSVLAPLPSGFPVGARQDALWENTYARFDAACARNGGSVLQHATSTDAARDMNLIREAIGVPTIDYLGASYGTGLGAIYANLFPSTVGRMILDGNLNPKTWSASGSLLPDALREGADLATAADARSFLNLCGQAATAACAFSAGTPAATQAKYATLLRSLRKHAVTFGSPPQTVTYADAVSELAGGVGITAEWPTVAAALQQAWAASAGVPGPAAGSASAPKTASHAADAPTAAYAGPEQVFAEQCADVADPSSTRTWEADARLAAARSGPIGVGYTWAEEQCAAWPAGTSIDRYTGPWNHRTASPVLVLGNTRDPITPFSDSVAMSRELGNARLLTINEFGHTALLNANTCATSYEISYLTAGSLPPAGTVCQQDAPPFPTP